jgi:hypothetical protein
MKNIKNTRNSMIVNLNVEATSELSSKSEAENKILGL